MNLPRQLFLVTTGLAGAAALGAPPDSWVDYWHLTGSVTTEWVKNISHTTDIPSRSNAMTYGLNLDATHPQQVTHDWLLEAGADAAFLSVPEFDLNSTADAGLQLALQRKFGLGPLAPVLRFDGAYRYKFTRFDGDDGWTAEAGLSLTKRLTSSVKVSANGRWLDHYARHATFDIQQRTLSLEADWDISERWSLNAVVGRQTGGFIAHAEGEDWTAAVAGSLGPAVANYYKTIPHETTDSYGPEWVTYNVDARANLLSLTLAYQVSDETTLALQTSHASVVNKADLRYPTDSWGLSLIHRF